MCVYTYMYLYIIYISYNPLRLLFDPLIGCYLQLDNTLSISSSQWIKCFLSQLNRKSWSTSLASLDMFPLKITNKDLITLGKFHIFTKFP